MIRRELRCWLVDKLLLLAVRIDPDRFLDRLMPHGQTLAQLHVMERTRDNSEQLLRVIR